MQPANPGELELEPALNEPITPTPPLKTTDGRLKANRVHKAQLEDMAATRHATLLAQYVARDWKQSWLKWLKELLRDHGYETGVRAAHLAQRIIDSEGWTAATATATATAAGGLQAVDWQALHEGTVARITKLEDELLALRSQLGN